MAGIRSRAGRTRTTSTTIVVAMGTPKATRLPRSPPSSSASPSITAMPISATTIAIQIAGCTRSRKTSHAAAAAKRGSVLVIAETLATVVSVTACTKLAKASPSASA